MRLPIPPRSNLFLKFQNKEVDASLTFFSCSAWSRTAPFYAILNLF